MSWHPQKIILEDGTELSWERFCDIFPTEFITSEIDKEILEQLKNNKLCN
jgi:hypothetical protein